MLDLNQKSIPGVPDYDRARSDQRKNSKNLAKHLSVVKTVAYKPTGTSKKCGFRKPNLKHQEHRFFIFQLLYRTKATNAENSKGSAAVAEAST